MRPRMRWMLAGALALGGCGTSDAKPAAPARGAGGAGSAPARTMVHRPPLPMTAADSAAARTQVAAERDSIQAAFSRVRPITAREVALLRQDVNAEQLVSARALGLHASGPGEIASLVRAGRLAALGDSTSGWVLRDMDHSEPYVVPDARGMLVALARRFHERLARLGLPRYRLKITSAMRTDASQEELRKINSYATRSTSTHTYGTTMDVSHERFAVPVEPRAGGAAEMERAMLEEVGKANAPLMEAELGRAILDMRAAGELHVMMENLQPVYHITVARHFAPDGTPR